MGDLHRRHHNSLLAAAERRLLVAIATRLPAWVTSDGLTLLALTSMVAAGTAFAWSPGRPWAAAAAISALTLNWFGDSLDGTLARVRRRERPRYGYYVDHVVDLAGAAALIVGIGCSGAMHPLVAGALLVGYILVAAESFLATHATGVFRVSFGPVGPTELRILLIAAAVRVAAAADTSALNVGGTIGAIGLLGALLVSTIRTTRALSRAEPLERGGQRAA